MKTKLTALLFLTFFLSACGGTPSVKKLVKDEALFKATFEECLKLGPLKAKEEKKCINLAEATKQKLKNSLDKIN